jgi:hypothetical protein
MKSRTALALILLASVLLCDCESDLADSLPAERISVAEAEVLVRDMMFDLNPDMNPSLQFPLEEITTDEIWRRLHTQVFRLQGGFPEMYAITNGQASILGASFGGYGVIHMHVTDLDADGNPELTYAYSWGSGLHRSHIAVYLPHQEPPTSIEAEIVYLHGDFILEKHNDQNVVVKVGYYECQEGKFIAEVPVGQLFLRSQDGQLKLVIELDDDLPAEIAEKIVIP